MCRILIHKKTNQRLLLKRGNSLVSTLYILDENNNKILKKNNKGKVLLNVKGEKRYKIAICLNDNLKPII